MKKNIRKLLLFILFFNIFTYLFSFFSLNFSTTFIGMAILAYSLGLKHAFDADHIAAIDNVTRKLKQDGVESESVGLYFSLGHSTVVILLSTVVIFTFRNFKSKHELFKNLNGLVGSIVSATFLILIGILNFFILLKLIKTYKSKKNTSMAEENELSIPFLKNFFKRVYKYINTPKKMFFIGFLFGLGFDTATEIGILSLTAIMSKSGTIPIYGIFSFPLLFTSGMATMDTLDGILMFKIYDWAIKDTRRKIGFNITITSLTILTALVIGSVETLQIILSKISENTSLLKAIENINFEITGLIIVGIMVSVWISALFYYKKLTSN